MKEIYEIVIKQLRRVQEVSDATSLPEELAALTKAMAELVNAVVIKKSF